MPGSVRSPVRRMGSRAASEGGSTGANRTRRAARQPTRTMGAVARPWDQRSASENRRAQDQALRQTLLQMQLGHVPTARARLNAAGIDARRFKGIDELTQIPPATRIEVLDPVRNPEGAYGMILQGTSEGVRRFSDRSVLYRVAAARLFGGEEVQQLAIEAASRPIHVHLAPGPG